MDKYCCTICIKNYASYGSLWNHNNKFHSNSKNTVINLHKFSDKSHPNSDKSHSNSDKSHLINKKDFDKLQCYYCNIFLKNRFNKNYHIKKCKEKYPNVQIMDDDNYKCDICNKEFTCKTSIYKHKKNCVDNKILETTVNNITGDNIINNNSNNTINNTNIINANINNAHVIKILNFSMSQCGPTDIFSKKDRKNKIFDFIFMLILYLFEE